MIESSFSLIHLTKKLSRRGCNSQWFISIFSKRPSVYSSKLSPQNPRNDPAQQRVSSVGVGPDKARRITGIFASQVFEHPGIVVGPWLEAETTVLQVAWDARVVGEHRPDRNWIVRLRIKPHRRQD
ncbi:hypothetical protein CEE34_10930 [Candidatus Aerophobetes bacterium Ae_b3a]|nr:MAG: hypothetical protein CEE34_10930 [Candidatus Aerophobetes bacterium Ae_b3a]